MTESDDFSPEDVYKLFPTAYPMRPHVEPPETTTSGALNATVATTVEPGLDFFYGINGTWIFGESEDSVVLPLLLGVIGVLSLLGNGLVTCAVVAVQRMRTGPNLMLLNVTAGDVVFMLLCVPTAVINHATPAGLFSLPGVEVCKFVHYMIFVTVYVSIYSLVVSCVFRFSGDYLSKTASTGGANPLLSCGNAVITSLVIWTAFILSHLNFLVQREGAVFQEPFICLHTYVLPEANKMKTLWVTFLTCAFLLPLLTICTLSAVVLHRQRRNRAMVALRRVPPSPDKRNRNRNAPTSQQYEMAQNELNEQRSSREITLVLMASMVTRAICWLPIQIFVMIDIFGMTEITEVYRKAEMVGVCCAFIGTCLSPLLYNCLSADFKAAFGEIFRRMGCRCVAERVEDEVEVNETILSIISDSSNQTFSSGSQPPAYSPGSSVAYTSPNQKHQSPYSCDPNPMYSLGQHQTYIANPNQYTDYN